MVCSATRKNIVIGLMLAAAYAVFATPGQAEELETTKVAKVTAPSDEAESQKRFAAEIKPLPMIVTLLPGSYGIGGEFEAKMSRNFTVFADASHLHMKLTDRMLSDVQDDQDEPESVPREMSVTSMAAGGRYYADAFASSWYTGAKLGGGTAHVNWAYDKERYDDDSLFYMAGVEAGYRWLWDSGFLIRLGFGVNATMVPRRDVTQVAATDAGEGRNDIEDKAPTKKTTGSAAFDFGLGYTF